MKIDFAKLQYQNQLYKTEIDKSNYIMSNEVVERENTLQNFIGFRYSISVHSCANVQAKLKEQGISTSGDYLLLLSMQQWSSHLRCQKGDFIRREQSSDEVSYISENL